MRALVGRIYQGLQAVSALYVLAVLALPATATPDGPPVPPPLVLAEAPKRLEPALTTASVAKPDLPKPPEPAVAAAEAALEAPKEKERPRVAIGFNLPEGQFDFELGAPAPKFGNAGPNANPFVPPPPAPAFAPNAPPVMYRRGLWRGPMRVYHNPWSGPGNFGVNNQGDAARARAFAFDDRPEPPGAGLNPNSGGVVKSWRRDVEQYRLLTALGHGEEDLKHRLGDRFSSVHWAATLDVALDNLPAPPDSYAAALARERKPTR